jgi:hypothetical protein
VKNYIESLGYELVSEEYENNHAKLILKDKDGYYYVISLSNLKWGKSPNKFDKLNQYTVQNIRLWCKLNNKSFELISEIYNGSEKYLKWECLNEDCKEEFKTVWSNIYSGRSCPYCSGKQVGISNCLATKKPVLAKEWHPTKNGNLTPYDVTCGSSKKVWWICEKGHEWEASRNKGSGCPQCSGRLPTKENNLLNSNPDLCKEWNYKKNIKKPEEYTPYSTKKVWWQCSKNIKHKWKASILNRNFRRDKCPYCSGRNASEDYNLKIINPKLCGEWDYNKNKKKPEEYTPGSNQKVWWKCRECRHEWKATIHNRSNGRNCPECNLSKGELRIKDILIKFNILYISQKEFDGLIGLGNGLLSYDFYLLDYNLLIEYQGIQHEKFCRGLHKSKKDFEKQREHDRHKKEYAYNNNIKLLEIWYWDYDNIEEILTNYLKEMIK